MTSRDFCFWLQGFFEVSGVEPASGQPKELQPWQAACIQRHLALVFKHEIDPSMGQPAHQQVLDKVHAPPKVPAPGLAQQLEALKRPDPTDLVYRC